jgi:hypothetical protein
MGAPFAWGARRAPFETLSAPPRPVEGSYTQGYGVSHEGRCRRRAWHRRSGCAGQPVVSRRPGGLQTSRFGHR